MFIKGPQIRHFYQIPFVVAKKSNPIVSFTQWLHYNEYNFCCLLLEQPATVEQPIKSDTFLISMWMTRDDNLITSWGLHVPLLRSVCFYPIYMLANMKRCAVTSSLLVCQTCWLTFGGNFHKYNASPCDRWTGTRIIRVLIAKCFKNNPDEGTKHLKLSHTDYL
jgi:hypothetical protein